MGFMPDDDEGIDSDLEAGLKWLSDHHDEYQRRNEFYEGKRNEIITHPDLAKLLAPYTDEFRLNYAAVPADALNDRVDLAALTVADDESLSKRLNDDFYIPNELDDDADDFHLKAMYLGDYYGITWPKPTTDGTVGAIELFGKHPLNAAILYDKENNRDPQFGLYRWQKGKHWRVNVYYDDAVVEYVTEQKGGAGTSATEYVRLTDPENPDDDGIIENPVGLFPMHHWRQDSKPYGRPVNFAAYGPQDAITKINATEMGNYDYVGYPQRYATLSADAEADDDIAEDFADDGTDLPEPAAGLEPDASEIVDAKGGKLRSAPGSTWLLRGVDKVGEFAAGTNESFLNGKSAQIKAAATLTRTPLYEFDLEAGGDQPSGEARRRADGPITKHATKVKGTYGRTWQGVGAFCLKAWGVGEGKTVRAIWLPSELATDTEGMALVAEKVKNGVPPQIALQEAGYSETEVAKWLPEGTLVTPAVLVEIATALQQLGQAKTLGAVSDQNILNLLPGYLVGDRPEPSALPVPKA